MARMATAAELDAFRRLQAQIARQSKRNQKRTLYADAERLLDAYGMTLPDGKTVQQTPMFWPGKAIEVFSSRLRPAGFTLDDSGLLNDLERALDEGEAGFIEQMAINAALRHGPAFVFTTPGDTAAGEPRVLHTASSALAATATVNRAGTVTSALELLGDRRANIYMPGLTLHVEQLVGGRLMVIDEIDSPTRVPCAPYVHGATLERPFGTSRITRPIMGLTDAGVRTFMRSEVSAEWYSNPRERMLGVDPEAFEGKGWVRMPGGVDMLPDIHPDDEPNYPESLRRAEIHYSPQASQQPFSDQMRLIGGLFSGASSIPPNYLGIIADSNPTSAQAIWAQEVDLVRSVEDQQPSFNRGRRAMALNTLTALYGDFDAREVSSLKSQWQEARTRSPLEQGQFVAQQIGAGNFQAGTKATLDLLPISPDAARVHADENRAARGSGLLDKVLTREPRPTTAPTATV